MQLTGASTRGDRSSAGGWWISGLLLLATMITGLSALLICVGPPYLHMLALMAGTGTVAYAYRADTLHKIAQLRGS